MAPWARAAEVTDRPAVMGRLRFGAAVLACWLLAGGRAQGTSWPVAPVLQEHQLLSSYGQFYENAGGGLHFHEGIDVQGTGGDSVFAVRKGQIARLDSAANPYNSYIVLVDLDAAGNPKTTGYTYLHVVPKAGLKVGDVIEARLTLGTMAPGGASGHPDHMHLDRGDGWDPTAGYGDVLKPVDDPLLVMTPRQDPTKPTLTAELKFRRADDDKLGRPHAVGGGLYSEDERTDSRYFYQMQCNTYLCIGNLPKTKDQAGTVFDGSADIDIIGQGYDLFRDGTSRLGLHSLGFSAEGSKWKDSTGNVTSFLFEGEFVDGQSYGALRDAQLTRVPYENDWMCNSEDDTMNPANVAYWHILTNRDDDLIVEKTDRDRCWNTDATKGSAWNDTAAAAAINNATSAFRDDIYGVKFWGRDEAWNTTTVEMQVLLDNWLQTIQTDKKRYYEGEDIYVQTGLNYSAYQLLPLYCLTAQPTDCMLLSGLWGDTTTDQNGVALRKALGSLPIGSYWLVSDYNLDTKYYSRLDAWYAFEVVPIPEPLTVSGVLLGAWGLSAYVRRRLAARG